MKKSAFKIIQKSATEFLKPRSIEETYAVIIREVARLVKATLGSIFLLKNNQLIRVYSNLPLYMQTTPRQNGYTARSIKEGKQFLVSDRQMRKNHPEITHKENYANLLIPLKYENKTVGVLSIHTEKFTKESIEILNLFSTIASLAIRKTQFYLESEKSVKTRDYFINLASHELKTPLTVIKVYSSIIQKKINSGGEIKKEWVEKLATEVERLVSLTNELLKIDQIKTGNLKFSWKEVNINTVLRNIIDNYKSMKIEHLLEFDTKAKKEDQLLIVGDKDKITQAFVNIINNSVKFSKKGSKIKVILKIDKNYYTVIFKDFGEGIPKEEINHIFDKFFKGSKDREGLGLGLYLTEQIIKAHGGFISLDSEVNYGTTVKIRLPKIEYVHRR